MRAVLFEEQSKKKNDNKKNRENKSWLVSLAKVKKREGLKISKTYQTENKNLKKTQVGSPAVLLRLAR